jgi:hypothetical protein
VKRVAPLQVMLRPPIPWRPAGGVFLALVGLGLMAAVAFGGDGVADLRMFFIGVGCGIVALMFTSCRSERQLAFKSEPWLRRSRQV